MHYGDVYGKARCGATPRAAPGGRRRLDHRRTRAGPATNSSQRSREGRSGTPANRGARRQRTRRRALDGHEGGHVHPVRHRQGRQGRPLVLLVLQEVRPEQFERLASLRRIGHRRRRATHDRHGSRGQAADRQVDGLRGRRQHRHGSR